MFDLGKRIGGLCTVLFVAAAAGAACGEIPAAGDGGPGDDGGPPQVCGDTTCSPNGTCTNAATSTCECKPGFTGDGESCQDVDECKDLGTCGPNASCANTIGSFTCSCDLGHVPDPGGQKGCVPRWALVWEDDLVLGDGHAAAIGPRIYYGVEAQPAPTFRSIDTTTGKVSDEAADPDNWCRCGYTGRLNATSDGNLIFVGNAAKRYDTATGVWVGLDYPPEMQEGEAGQAIVGSKLVMIGGRNKPTALRRYDLSTGMWLMLGTLPASSEYAAAVGIGDDVYAYGGNVNGQQSSLLVKIGINNDDTFTTAMLANAPAAASRPRAVARGGKVLADIGGELAVYDPANNTWAAERIPLPPGFGEIIPVVVNEQLWLVAGGNGLAKTRFLKYFE